MHRFKFILIAAFIASIFIISNAYGSPKAFIETPLYDAGNVPQGKKIEHNFFLKNTGDEVLSYKIKGC